MEAKISPELIALHGLSEQEYARILEILGREPSYVELGIFSVMWSEHASYKNSIKLIKTLPREGRFLLAKAGEENAGVVDIGDGLAVSFKIESHNHPSALEPYHGAATGVGGILRDIFTMGARPVAALNSLRFGDPASPRTRHLIRGVVQGIADYGNCFGVPTVGGEVFFDEAYEGNPLVNAMAVGVLRHEHLARSAASGTGNLVVYVGAKTGRDGIHGATFASVDLSEQSAEMRTAVQVGDPFYEKLLLEATLEVIQAGLVVGIQDMGAAGLTCSSSEMAGKGGVGIELDLEHVPIRETGITPYEIMLSESQERMLLIVEPAKLEAVQNIFEQWDLDAVVIGRVTADKFLRVRLRGETLAEIPAETLVLGGSAPVYEREQKAPARPPEWDPGRHPEPADPGEVLLRLLGEPNIASKRQVFSQYDHMVQIGTTVEPGSDAAVIAVKGTRKALALSTDCNARHCWLDPFEGAKGAVAEAARNVACSGARPIAVTNCLNFGNPYKPEVYWSFAQCVKGMGEACRAFETPVTGGNVSFYNENPAGAIWPTPVIGMLGLIDDVSLATTQWFKRPGDLIALLGEPCSSIGGSQYLKTLFAEVAGPAPKVDLAAEKHLIGLLLDLISAQALASAHDVSEGGLLVCLAESCFQPEQRLGARITFILSHPASAEYFGESHGRAVISFAPAKLQAVEALCRKHSTPLLPLGEVASGREFTVNQHLSLDTEDMYRAWTNGLKLS
ncbi:MAG: phosphoribosylformylglycinamidine synthase subunit PurL [Candidatus Cloacimonetes bacterium]|nr:phosphoribosylformylglycinamidine synthase subunit PurL [Candidatus Cloacimonadota bacterium]